MKKLIDFTGIIGGLIVGIILGVGSTFYIQGQKIAKLENQIETLNKVSPVQSQSENPDRPEVNPDELVNLIKEQQSIYVRESRNEYDCFTDNDLNNFITSRITTTIVNNLKRDNHFIDIVLAIKKMPLSEWQKLKTVSLNTYKPTWGQQRVINSNGQTEGGQRAEKMIATAIVNFVIELLNKSEKDIRSMYTY